LSPDGGRGGKRSDDTSDLLFSCLAFQPFLLYIDPFVFSYSTVNLETIRAYCLKKPGKITEGFPFGEDVLVFKLNGKIFLLVLVDEQPLALNLKCDPEQAIEWREQYEAVQPGYHMNKKHWNTVTLDGSIPRQEVLRMIDHSYEQVVKGLKKSDREKLLKHAKQKLY